MTEKPYRVLFVCTGNSCRSPMAEGILKNLLLKENIPDVEVKSSGTYATAGSSPTEYAIFVMLEHRIDISTHLAQPLTQEILENSDLILVMEKIHKRFLEAMWPFAADRIFLLKSYGQDNKMIGEEEIEDPIGRDLEIYRTCYEELEWEIKRIFPLIIRLIRRDK